MNRTQRPRNLLLSFLAGLGGASLALAGLAGARAIARDSDVIDVLNVRRINVVNGDGTYALVLANSSRLPGVIRGGKESKRSRRGIPGILFYNNRGDEVGGLVYPYRDTENGVDAGVQLSMDQVPHAQTISLIHWRNGDFVRSGLRVTDYPTDIGPEEVAKCEPCKAALADLRAAKDEEAQEAALRRYFEVLGEHRLMAERIYLGSEGEQARKAMLELKDSRSRPRLRFMVDEHDRPHIEVLDENGDVVQSLVETSSRTR